MELGKRGRVRNASTHLRIVERWMQAAKTQWGAAPHPLAEAREGHWS